MPLLENGFLNKNFPLIAGKTQNEIESFTPEEAVDAAREMYGGLLTISHLKHEKQLQLAAEEKAALTDLFVTMEKLVSIAGGCETVLYRTNQDYFRIIGILKIAIFDILSEN